MGFYRDSEHLYHNLKSLFQRIHDENHSATRSVSDSRMIIRLQCTQPSANILINGRTTPLKISYGVSRLKPDLDIDLTSEALHRILLGELTLVKALGSGQMKVKGPLWKTTALQDIFHQGQQLYPQILRDSNFPVDTGA